MPPVARRARSAAAIWGFLAFTHALTWTFWLMAAARGENVWESRVSTSLLVAGGLGVPLGGVVMTGVVLGRAGLADLWRRMIDPTRVKGWWWAAVLLLYPALKLAAIALDALIGGQSMRVIEPGVAWVQLLPLALVVFLLGPLPEEIGWRGYLQDRLNERAPVLTASVLLGVLWAAWHFPLFLIPGYFERAGGAPHLVPWSVTLLLTSVVMGWVYVNTSRSVLAAILLHFTDNLSGEILAVSDRARAFTALLLLATVASIVLLHGRELRSSRARTTDG